MYPIKPTLKPATTSFALAKDLGVNHKDLLRSIYKYTEEADYNFAERNFALSYYRTSLGKDLPMFNLSTAAALILTSERTGKNAIPIKAKVATKITQLADERQVLMEERQALMEERQILLEERAATLQLEHDTMAVREPRGTDTLPVMLGISSRDTREVYKILVEKGIVEETRHVTCNYTYRPTIDGMEHVKSIKGRTIHWKASIKSIID